eukprot:5062952-Lingulodinium_polyedra.AAC.1
MAFHTTTLANARLTILSGLANTIRCAGFIDKTTGARSDTPSIPSKNLMDRTRGIDFSSTAG